MPLGLQVASRRANVTNGLNVETLRLPVPGGQESRLGPPAAGSREVAR
jgi:hypothetical protein